MPKERILIVEDEAITSVDIQGELENLGYQVVGAAFSGQEALEIAFEHKPDLVLMDINLRGPLDGITTALKLREAAPTPVIFVTAMVDDETIQRTKLCEPYGYIIKPIRQDDLHTAIEHALYKHAVEGKLRQSEARFRDLFETSLDGIVNTDSAGIILGCNSAFAQLTGYSSDELVGMRLASLSPPRDPPEEIELIEKPADKSGFLYDSRKEFIRRDGSLIPVSVRRWSSKNTEDKTVGFWEIVRDISWIVEAERKKMRQADFAQKLIDLAALLNKQLDLPDLYQMVCEEMVQKMDVDFCTIALREPNTQTMRYVHWLAPAAIHIPALNSYPLEFHTIFARPGEQHEYFHNLQDEPRLSNHDILVKYDFRSAIILNLVYESEIIGALDLASIGKWRTFSEDEIHFMLAFANQVAVAIDRARLFQQVRNRANELEKLARLSANLRPVANQKEMLPVLLNGVLDMCGADFGSIYLLGPAGNPIDRFQRSTHNQPLEDELILGGEQWGRALTSEELVYVPNSSSLPVDDTDPQSDLPMCCSLMLIPLRSVNTLSAIIAIGFDTPHEIEPELKIMLTSMVEMGGNALHRSGLMEMIEKQARERSSELDTLYELSVFINSSASYEEKLNATLVKTIKTVKASLGAIYLYRPENSCLVLETQHNFPPKTLLQAYEIKLTAGLKTWLETSRVPWLTNRGDGQSSPISGMGSMDFQTIINIPIRFENGVYGLLNIIWQDKPDLAPENIAFLIAISERIGNVIHNDLARQRAETAALLEERQRLAREFHDSVSQTIYSLTLMTEAGKDLLAQRKLSLLENCLRDMGDTSVQALKEMRLLLFELRDVHMDKKGLVQALQFRLDGVERRAGVKTSLDSQGIMTLSLSEQAVLYRVAVEALNNSLKHSGAKSVRIRLHSSESGLLLSIEDDGKGFETEQLQSAGMGFTNMQERVSQLGGKLSIQSEAGKGTTVKVEIEV